MIFDGRCGFCRIWIEYWKQLTVSKVDYAASQEVGANFPEIPPERFSQSVQLAMPDGEVIAGARAVFVTLTFAPGMAWLLWLYDHVQGFAPVTEAAVQIHRRASQLLLRGHALHFRTADFAAQVRPRGVAVPARYWRSFTSRRSRRSPLQIKGLVGDARHLAGGAVFRRRVGKPLGAKAYWLVPSLFWMVHSDFFLRAACWAGAAIAVVLLCGFLRADRAGLSVPPLSIAVLGRTGFSGLPMGHAAARSRLSGHLSGIVEMDGVAVPLAAVPPDVSVGLQ